MRRQKMLEELRGCSRRPPPRCMFIFIRCFDTEDTREAFRVGCPGIQQRCTGQARCIASHSSLRGPRQGDRKSRTTLQRRSQRTARLYHCHDNRGRHPVGSPVSPAPSCRAPQLSPAPPDPARPSSAHLPGAPRPGHSAQPQPPSSGTRAPALALTVSAGS